MTADTDVTVTVPGGTLVIRWSGDEQDPVLMTGPAEEIARIELEPAWAAQHGLADHATTA